MQPRFRADHSDPAWPGAARCPSPPARGPALGGVAGSVCGSPVGRDEYEGLLSALSESDLECLHAVWAQYGHLPEEQLHANTAQLSEWSADMPPGTEIPLAQILRALPLPEERVRSQLECVAEWQAMAASLATK